MSQVSITNRFLRSLKPSSKPFFIRDNILSGFAVKVNPSGTLKFIAEVWHEGRSSRKTLGEYPILDLSQARLDALAYISQAKSGLLVAERKEKELSVIFQEYISDGRLKERTITDYREAIFFYLSDWLNKPVTSITKEMVEKRFCQIRDKGIHGGKPTYSQATKVMRVLSALMNYAMADEAIESNPVDVLKRKRIDRSIRTREQYLTSSTVRALLEITAQDSHPVTLAVHLMLYTGLRKNEALRLKWSDIEVVEGIQCIIICDTKNHRPHYLPVTNQIKEIIDKAVNGSDYLFPSTQRENRYISDVRPALKRLARLIGGEEFRCHDLRRTFATRASELGVDYLMIKRLLNHKSNDITAKYIQFHSRKNLLIMHDALQMIRY